MKNEKKAGISAYLVPPLMIAFLYLIASLFFALVFKDFGTVIFFILLGSIFIVNMVIYALVPLKAKNIVRIISIFMISALLFGLACIMGKQNFQIEGLFFYIFTGTMGGVIIHFILGKILGPVLIGRTWCGWGCWSLMVFELLPFKESRGFNNKLKYLKYIHFALSLVLVAVLVFVFKYYIHDLKNTTDGTLAALYWFITGNILYYLSGIVLAFILKDNRAFCKYLCPVSLFLKFANIFSVLRIKGDKTKCVKCNKCVNICMFNIDIPSYIKEEKRVKSTECVMCMKCIAECPEGALKTSIGLDLATKDYSKDIKD